MKKKEKLDGTDLIHKIEVAERCAVFGDHRQMIDGIRHLLSQLREAYTVDGSENPYFKNITITSQNCMMKCDVWLKMAMVDFNVKTKIWIPKVFSACKEIPYLNGCN